MTFASGVFALEGDPGEDSKRQYSVRPLLQLLNSLNDTDFMFRDIGTVEELQHYVRRWTLAKNNEFDIGYFSFHGSPGALWFPDGRKSPVTLEDLGGWLHGRAEGRIIHFCACSAMRLGEVRLQDFRERTGAKAVMGYRTDVDWAESMAFDTLLFSALRHYARLGDVVNYLDRVSGTLRERLGFRAIR